MAYVFFFFPVFFFGYYSNVYLLKFKVHLLIIARGTVILIGHTCHAVLYAARNLITVHKNEINEGFLYVRFDNR